MEVAIGIDPSKSSLAVAAVDPFNEGVVWAGTDEALLKPVDGGELWAPSIPEYQQAYEIPRWVPRMGDSSRDRPEVTPNPQVAATKAADL